MLYRPLLDPATGRVRFRHNALPPGGDWVYLRGVPIMNSTTAVISQGAAAIANYSNGVPIDINGAVAIVVTGTVSHYSGGLPFTSAGRVRVAVPAAAVDHYSNGVPFTVEGYVHGIQV